MKNNPNVIITGLEKLESDLNNLESAASDGLRNAANQIRDEYKQEILSARAFVTGEMYENARAFVLGSETARSFVRGNYTAREFVIGSDTDHTLVFELGRTDGANYKGRHLLEKAFNHAGENIPDHIFAQFDRTLTGSE